MSSKKYLGENSKEEAKTETKYMLLSQLTNAFLIVNNLLKKKKKSFGKLGHQKSHTMYFYINNNRSSIQTAKKDLAHCSHLKVLK